MIRFALFDLYGTLVDFRRGVVHQATRVVADRIGADVEALVDAEQELMPERLRGAFGKTLEDELRAVLRHAGARHDDEAVQVYREVQGAGWLTAAVVRDGLVEGLEVLKGAGFGLGLLSNAFGFTPGHIGEWFPPDLFDEVILSCEVGLAKPDPAIFQVAVERLGATCPSEVLFVDDSRTNVEAAQRLGLRTKLARQG